MSEEDATRPALAARLTVVLDRAERVYLRVLRAIILIIATLMIIYAAWLAASSMYKIVQSPDSVKEKTAVVAPDELTDAEMPSTNSASSAVQGEPEINPAHRKYYSTFANRYYALFRSKFEPFRQHEDKQLSRDEFDDAFISSETRLAAVTSGNLNFNEDKVDLETLIAVMTQAAGKPRTQERLQKYRAAKKMRVAKEVQRTRTIYRRGWDSYSTACEDWYYSPMGCAVRRPVKIPYSETVYAMEFPKGTQSHTQIFRAFQDRFYQLLDERRKDNAMEAATERASIVQGNLTGTLSLYTALQVIGGFLVLMFFFLLIAIERHQRKISSGASV